MRILGVTKLLLAIALVGVAAPANACCGYGTIQIAGTLQNAIQRNHYLLGVNDNGHILVVDLARYRAFDLGEATKGQWIHGDVADGQLLLPTRNGLVVIDLVSRKTVHEVELKGDKVRVCGFVGKDRVFINDGDKVVLLDLATKKTVSTVQFVRDEGRRLPSTAWQKVGERLFFVGVDSELCVIDLTTGELSDRFWVDSRAGIERFFVQGDQVMVIGSPLTWAAKIDHLTCFNLKTKKSTICELDRVVRKGGRIVGATDGSTFLISENAQQKTIDVFDKSGKLTHIATPTLGEGVKLWTVWENEAVVSMKGLVLFLDIDAKPVVKK